MHNAQIMNCPGKGKKYWLFNDKEHIFNLGKLIAALVRNAVVIVFCKLSVPEMKSFLDDSLVNMILLKKEEWRLVV